MEMASSSSSNDQKGPDACAICLQQLVEEAYLDQCFHSFCYSCIVSWCNVVRKKHSRSQSSIKCPLCKSENFSIIYGFNGQDFKRRYVNQGEQNNYLSSAHDFRLQWYESGARVPCDISDVHLYWKVRRYLRRNIWLEPWLKREIQALTREEDVEVIVHHLYGAIDNFIRRQQLEGISRAGPEEKRKIFIEQLSDAARPFLLERTERFVDEVEMFLVQGLNIEAYDAICMQMMESRATTPG